MARGRSSSEGEVIKTVPEAEIVETSDRGGAAAGRGDGRRPRERAAQPRSSSADVSGGVRHHGAVLTTRRFGCPRPRRPGGGRSSCCNRSGHQRLRLPLASRLPSSSPGDWVVNSGATCTEGQLGGLCYSGANLVPDAADPDALLLLPNGPGGEADDARRSWDRTTRCCGCGSCSSLLGSGPGGP